MSLLKTVQLVCDGDDCNVAYAPDFRDLADSTEQRRKARTQGWRRSGGKDLCPGCVAKEKTP